MKKRSTIGFGNLPTISLVLGLISLGFYVEANHTQQQEEAYIREMSKVTSTLAANGFSSDLKKADFASILTANGMEDYELSFIAKNETDDGFIKVLSSDPLYQSDEPFRDPEGRLSEIYTHSDEETREYEGGVRKNITYAPVVENGMIIGIYRLSSGALSDIALNWKRLWPWAIGLILLILQVTSNGWLKSSQKDSISMDKKLELDSELRKKDTELKMLSLVAKKSQNLMLITDDKGIILWVNETYENRNNYSAAELNTFVGSHLPEVSKNTHIRTIIRNVVDFKKSVVYESESCNDKGMVHYAMTTVTPVSDDNGKVHKLLFVDTDITKLKAIEKENEAFKKFAELTSTPIFRVNRAGEVTFQNQASNELLRDWCGSQSILNERMSTLTQGVLDSCETYSFEHKTEAHRFTVCFHPNCEDQTVDVIAEFVLSPSTHAEEAETKDDNLVG